MIPQRIALGVLIGLGAFAGTAVAQTHEGQRIIALDVRGMKAVAKETILAKVQTKPGSPYRSDAISEDIRRIFATGYFTNVEADVTTLPDGLQLTFVVTEKPSIASVTVEGNRALARPKVLELFAVGAGELYDPRKVKEGIDFIKAEYIRRGFSQCEVVSHLQEDAGANTVTISLLVDEGPKMRIAGVLVEGNTAFSDQRVRKLLKTKRRKWLVRGVYDEQVVAEDLERVRVFYRKHGYQDADATSDVYRDPSGRGLYVHLKVTEGLQYRVGAVALGGVVLFPEPEIRRVITLKPGAVYHSDALQDDLRAIKQYYGDRGYINAEVTSDPQLDAATKRVNPTYRVTEHELVYVNRIAIRGNLSTKDVVARRELRIYPGERFDGSKIRKSVDRLYNLGFFEEVNVETEPTQTPNKENLVVQVKEAKTGSFSFGGGFSSVDRVVGLVELEQRNFDWRNMPKLTGAGQDLRLRMEVGTVRRYLDLSFTEPWIFNQPLSFGFDIFSRIRLRSRSLGLGFEEKRRGGGVRFGKEFIDLVRVNLGYQFFRTDISDVVEEASADLKTEQGRSDISVANLSVARDERDNRFEPTHGSYLFASTDLAGGVLAGDRDFYRLQGGASYYLPHAKRFVLESSARAGVVKVYGDSGEVPIFERFFGGGTGTIRGFRERHVGPRDPSSNDPIGGESLFVGTLEEVMTIVKDERGRPILKGSVFYDVGDVWRRANEFAESFKSGTGVGMRVTTPIGPVRLDIGFPISKIEGEDREVRFHFNVSRGF